MRQLLLRPEAREDALDAFSFYEAQRPGLGVEFRNHLDFALSKIMDAPERYPFIYRDLRRRLVERFPYAVSSLPRSSSGRRSNAWPPGPARLETPRLDS